MRYSDGTISTMEALSAKKPQKLVKKTFDRLDEVFAAREYEKTKARGIYYWCWRLSADFPVYLCHGKFGPNKLFIDAALSDLARILGALQGVIASDSGVTKNSKFEAFVAKKVNPRTGIPVYEGWRFQFANESAANNFLDVCDEYVLNGIDAAKEKAGSFEQTLTRTTSRKSVITARVGQNDFRTDLIRFWKACAVTGCKVTAVLRASHIKPWAYCDSRERLDSLNGLLLVASLDALFDAGLISFDDNGELLISPQLPPEEWPALGLGLGMRLRKVNSAHAPYLAYHRERVYKK